MGVNLTAVFPNTILSEKLDKVIRKIEGNEFNSINEYYKTTLTSGFPKPSDFKTLWYLNDMEINERPNLPNINAAIQLSNGLVLRFGNYGFEIWSLIRAFSALIHYPQIGKKLCEVYKEIGNEFGANECFIMGDNNPIYFSFLNNDNFVIDLNANQEKNELNKIYREIKHGEYKGSYVIEGYYRLNLNDS